MKKMDPRIGRKPFGRSNYIIILRYKYFQDFFSFQKLRKCPENTGFYQITQESLKAFYILISNNREYFSAIQITFSAIQN